MVQSHGRWVAIDRLDLERAATALAERESVTELTGAEILRQSIGLDGAGLGGAVVVHGDSWAKPTSSPRARRPDDRARRHARRTSPERCGPIRPKRWRWIGFLDDSELGGCLALDMGLGKTPTVLAHLARTAGRGHLAGDRTGRRRRQLGGGGRRFAPDLRVLVHHGAGARQDSQLEKEIADADVVITTYATAVRDVDALADAASGPRWCSTRRRRSRTRRATPLSSCAAFSARTRLALTGTPIENGVGDLWAILDFTNPGLVGPRPTFVAQLAGDGETALARAQRHPPVPADQERAGGRRRAPGQDRRARPLHDDDRADRAVPGRARRPDRQAPIDRRCPTSKGAILAAITALKQICNHPAAYHDDGQPLTGRSGKLTRLEEIVESVFAVGERVLIFTHFATWGRRLAAHLSEVTGHAIACYDGDLTRSARDRMVTEFQNGTVRGRWCSR